MNSHQLLPLLTANEAPLAIPVPADIALFAIADPEKMLALSEVREAIEEAGGTLGPPARAEDIAGFEAFFGMTLPPEYTLFLRVLGNGIYSEYEHFVECDLAGIPTRETLNEPEWQDRLLSLQTPFPLEEDAGFSGYYRELEITDKDRETYGHTDDSENQYDKFNALFEEAARNVHRWSQCGTWELQDGLFLVVNGTGTGTVWKVEDEVYPDCSGHHMLVQVGSFLDWLTDEEREW